MAGPITERAPAKVNLTLRVLRKRADGYHDLESLVAFADEADVLTLTPGEGLSLRVAGPHAQATGAIEQNLVVKAAQALAAEMPGLKLGAFVLDKNLPAAAGLGGGSSDAAAALRLLARGNAMAPEDVRLLKAARRTGADVPVCLDPKARMMRGIGHDLSAPIRLPALPAVLANPGVALATGDVFGRLVLRDGAQEGGMPPAPEAFAAWLARQENSLEAPARALSPAIGDVLAALSELGATVPRMSGSGATCFGLFETHDKARVAALALTRLNPSWWVRATVLR